MAAQPNLDQLDFSDNLQPGSMLRAKWQAQGNSHPLTIPLMTFAKRAWREHWPDGATAGAMLFDVAELSSYLHFLERRIDQLQGSGPR